jgi:hypothetical protein
MFNRTKLPKPDGKNPDHLRFAARLLADFNDHNGSYPPYTKVSPAELFARPDQLGKPPGRN